MRMDTTSETARTHRRLSFTWYSSFVSCKGNVQENGARHPYAKYPAYTTTYVTLGYAQQQQPIKLRNAAKWWDSNIQILSRHTKGQGNVMFCAPARERGRRVWQNRAQPGTCKRQSIRTLYTQYDSKLEHKTRPRAWGHRVHNNRSKREDNNRSKREDCARWTLDCYVLLLLGLLFRPVVLLLNHKTSTHKHTYS